MAEVGGNAVYGVCNCLQCRQLRSPSPPDANERAEALLREHLLPEQEKDWRHNRAFNVRGSGGRHLYRIQPNDIQAYGRGVVREDGDGIGVWPMGLYIPADWALAMLLWLQADEPQVNHIGCHNPYQSTRDIHDYGGKL